MNGGERKSWTLIDGVEGSYLLLADDDVCYYYLVRTSEGFRASKANSRIANFKKSPKYAGDPTVWRYKEREILNFADDVCGFLQNPRIAEAIAAYEHPVIVPMPTSVPKDRPGHDDRLERLCRIVAGRIDGLGFEDPLDAREATAASHAGGTRSVEAIKGNMVFRGFSATPDLVVLVDDVITTGAHYVACRDVVKRFAPDAQVIGLFLALHRSSKIDYGVQRF